MSYLIFARKFRPQTFDEVVGQEPTVTTLKNAIKQERIPQNFLFSGPRGVGKTSVARILAMALNAGKKPSVDFDSKSELAKEIVEGRSLDVLEIDGASNRGIDEIRNLRETVKFKPASGRYKIYIIDEVHMLTTEAFNALLKTLEEPPAHVKFIFATTEQHKVPLTILSRCQRFTFKRIPTLEIAAKLEEIAKKEKIQYEKNALFQMAKASDGALRDAEGLLDQLASFSDGKIKEEDVLLALGLAAEEVYFSVLEALKAKDTQKIFSIVAELYETGKDLVPFSKGLLELFRHLLLLQCTEKGAEFIEMSPEAIAELKKAKNDFSRGELLLALSLLGNLQGQLRRNLASPRLLVETALLKLLHVDGLQSIEKVIETGVPKRAVPTTSSGIASSSSKRSSRPPQDVGRIRQGSLADNDASGKAKKVIASDPPRQQVGAKPASPAGGQPQTKEQIPSKPSSGGTTTLDQVLTEWSRIIDYVKTKRMSIGIFLSEAVPVEVEGSVITLGMPTEFQFHKDMLEKETNKRLVEESVEVVLGQGCRVQFVITKTESASVPREVAPMAGAEDSDHLPEIITQAMDIFEGAKIVQKD